MKPKELKNLLAALVGVVLLASCGEKKKEAPAEEQAAPITEAAAPSSPKSASIGFDREELNAFFTQYLTLQQALVASESVEAQQAARKMAQLPLEEMPDISKVITALAKSDHLGQQRALFLRLNKAMVPYLEAHLSSGEIYRQYCPMAFENTGAFWFSDSEEILNPYFGDAMLHCGTVEKTYGAL